MHLCLRLVVFSLVTEESKFYAQTVKDLGIAILLMITRTQILALILNRLRVLGEELQKPTLVQATEQTRLFGDQADLDSMGLVTLIADLEYDVQTQWGKSVTLVDEKAMSRLTSPFRRVDYLADYLVELLNSAQS